MYCKIIPWNSSLYSTLKISVPSTYTWSVTFVQTLTPGPGSPAANKKTGAKSLAARPRQHSTGRKRRKYKFDFWKFILLPFAFSPLFGLVSGCGSVWSALPAEETEARVRLWTISGGVVPHGDWKVLFEVGREFPVGTFRWKLEPGTGGLCFYFCAWFIGDLATWTDGLLPRGRILFVVTARSSCQLVPMV